MTISRLLAGLLFTMSVALAQDETKTLLLWPDGAPGALGTADADKPSLTVYMPRSATKDATAVIVCPGGGYGALAMNHEGRQIANWLNSYGIVAFVLKYRLGPRYHHPIEMGDAQRAVRTVRARAKEFGVAADRVGAWGFSAGGHLASTIGTHFDAANANASDPIDAVSSRPDFLILAYPVISFTTPYTHKGSLKNLLGENPDKALVESLSNELQVTAQTPPTFLFSTNADAGVPAENAVLFYLALRKAKVPAELHVFQNGPHGVGLGNTDPALAEWPVTLANWLRVRGLVK
ncbi:MAG: alpha/beta hydrolase [Bryobacterales bacterium]|nr:alpha/beta hydrolase [Bryobacterales bacterium]